MANAVEYVIDQQSPQDGSWTGIAGVWGVTDADVLAAILAVFKDNDQTGVYRMVAKTRTETVTVTVVG